MDISFAKCESILNTLPIGYYAGRRISTTLDAHCDTSMYSPTEDSIVISYPIIKDRMQRLPDTANVEEAVRSMLYHEVSHAILTPANMRPDSMINIFEDERIETVLRNYYHNVDFRQQLYDIHGGYPPKATDNDSAFFNAVRFGLGTGKVQTKVNQYLKKYSHMGRNAHYYGEDDGKSIYHYINDILELYRMIADEFKQDPQSFQPQQSNQGEAKQMDSLTAQQEQGQGRTNTNNNNNNSSQEKQDGNGDMPHNIGDTDRNITMTKNELKALFAGSFSADPELGEGERQELENFQRTAEMIIGNFNKKNKNGSGINAYSGVFNPRAVARQDYRFFERAMSTQGNNKFGTCHLNLIIDCSGSFQNNVPITNGILAVLSEIERKNKNFTMDVAFCNTRLKMCNSVRERRMVANGGTNIPDDMADTLRTLQKPNTCNYTIILFDGDACGGGTFAQKKARFHVLDRKQTTVIIDPENEVYLENAPFTSAKVIVTENYTDELIKHITNALMVAFG